MSFEHACTVSALSWLPQKQWIQYSPSPLKSKKLSVKMSLA